MILGAKVIILLIVTSFDRIQHYIEDNPANWGMKNSKT
jgi:hypothetical protein